MNKSARNTDLNDLLRKVEEDWTLVKAWYSLSLAEIPRRELIEAHDRILVNRHIARLIREDRPQNELSVYLKPALIYAYICRIEVQTSHLRLLRAQDDHAAGHPVADKPFDKPHWRGHLKRQIAHTEDALSTYKSCIELILQHYKSAPAMPRLYHRVLRSIDLETEILAELREIFQQAHGGIRSFIARIADR